jgi:hypothetical protein
MPGAGEAKSHVTQIREWLKNPKVEVWTLYQAVLRHVLRDWSGQTMSVIIDGTMVFGDRWFILNDSNVCSWPLPSLPSGAMKSASLFSFLAKPCHA